jgi:hypothetical protein
LCIDQLNANRPWGIRITIVGLVRDDVSNLEVLHHVVVDRRKLARVQRSVSTSARYTSGFLKLVFHLIPINGHERSILPLQDPAKHLGEAKNVDWRIGFLGGLARVLIVSSAEGIDA